MKSKNIETECEEVRDALIALYINRGMPSFKQFKEFVDESLPNISELCLTQIIEAWEKARQHIEKVNEFVHEIRNFPSRKDIAEAIIRNRKQDSAIAFSLLDEKLITEKQYFDLIKQNI
jgi:hypothetical protein